MPSTTFDISVNDDEGRTRALTVVVAVEGAGHPTSRTTASITTSGSLQDADDLLERCAAVIERWADKNSVTPLDHREALATLLLNAAPDESGIEAYPCGPLGLKGSAPLLYPPTGSLARGNRTDDELPPVPDPRALSVVGRTGQRALRDLVDRSGGRAGLGRMPSIAVGHLDVLADVFDEWVNHYGDHQAAGIRWGNEHDGLWYALDRLYPLQKPGRVDNLRRAVNEHLEQTRGWRSTNAGKPGAGRWIPRE